MTDLEYVALAAQRARDRVQHDDEWQMRRVLRILADELATAVVERNTVRDAPEA